MGPGNLQKLRAKVEALQLSTEGLFKLLGSDDPSQREKFIEIWKGITSVADLQLIESQFSLVNTLVTQVEASVKTLTHAAKQIGASGAAGAGR